MQNLKSIRVLGPGCIALAFVLLAGLSWRRWADLLVDYGPQLYIPWQVSTGKVLGRDIMYLPGGPLSIYYHAFLFKCFGVSALTVIVSNLVLTAGMVGLIYRRFLTTADAWTASMVSLAVVMVFAFGNYSETGNYNYIAPYAQEVFHGLVLSVAAIVCLSTWLEKRKILLATLAGFIFGLVFLTKPEVFAALAVCVLAAFCLAGRKYGRIFLIQSGGLFLICAILPAILFALCSPAGFKPVLFPWQSVLGKSIEQNSFYRWCLGLDTPGFHVRMMVKQFLGLAVILGALAWVFRRKMETSIERIGAITVVALLLGLASDFNWIECGASLPLLMLVLLGQWKKLPAFACLWGVFSLFLLAKLGFYPRIWHYGFALAMPAFVAAIYLLVWVLPEALAKFQVRRQLFRGSISLVLLAGFVWLVIQSAHIYDDKTVTVGQGNDVVRAFKPARDPSGPLVVETLDWLEKHTPPQATMLALPQGTMINFLARRMNPTRYVGWSPPELEAFGQENMTADLYAHPPDYILLVHADSAEYNRKYFGQEKRFGLEAMQWIRTNYEPVALFGSEPLTNNHFGIKILQRQAAPKN